MNNYIDQQSEELYDDSTTINLTKSGINKLENIANLQQYHNSYADYMTFVNKLKSMYSKEDIIKARESEEQFIKTTQKNILDLATIIRATTSGYIVELTYNMDKHVTLVLPDFYFVTKYAPVPYRNATNQDYSIEKFIYSFNELKKDDLLYKAIKFHEANIPVRYTSSQKHGPKRVATFYKTFIFEENLQKKYTDIKLAKVTNQDCLKKGPGDNKPDFSYIENNNIKYAEAKMSLTFDEAISACKAVNMMPFPNRLYILRNNSELHIYDLDGTNIKCETVTTIEMPDISSFPETW